ncbi:MAG: hypothetical protein IPH21_04105 [Flavobacteriales bacterium]|nr:hypothetical protein [Flavobacteriales bacterium]
MRWYIVLLLVFIGGSAFAQTSGPTMDPAHASEYEIGGITVSGTVTTDPNAVKLFTGLQVGDKVTVPGERITNAIRQLWDQQLFSDVRIDAAEIRGRVIFLNIIVVEKPRLSRFKFKGPNKSEADKLREEIQLVRGQQVNDALIANASNAIERYYIDKGFLKASVNIIQINDTVKTAPENSVLLSILEVEKNKKVKIKDVVFTGNNNIKSRKLRKAMKKTRQKRWWNFFGSSKFLWSEYRNDKNSVLDLYNEKGYRNAAIVSDTMYFVREKRVRVEIAMDEGPEFRFRNITYTGNSKHSDAQLAEIMNINKGDIYNKKLLDSRLYMNQAGRDISSLYMDDGYPGVLSGPH